MNKIKLFNTYLPVKVINKNTGEIYTGEYVTQNSLIWLSKIDENICDTKFDHIDNYELLLKDVNDIMMLMASFSGKLYGKRRFR